MEEKLTNEDALRVLYCLSLAFHVGRLGDRDTKERRKFYSLASDAEYQDFLEVKKLGEVLEQLFETVSVSLSSPQHTFPDQYNDLKEALREARTGSAWSLYSELGRISRVAEPGDAKRLEQLIGGKEAIQRPFLTTPADPAGKVEHLLAMVESKEFLEIASRYANGPTAGHPASVCPTGLCRATNRLEYLKSYISCWADYVRRAREKHPAGARVDIGFSLPRETMEKLLLCYPKAGIESWRVPPSPVPPREQRDECRWSIPFETYEQLLFDLSAQLLRNLDDISRAHPKSA